MNFTPLLNDLSKGLWAMSFEGLSFWAPYANKLMKGELKAQDLQLGALLNVFDKDRRPVMSDENGQFDVPPGSVAVINMIGALIKYGDYCMYGADDIIKALDYVEANPNFIGAVVYIDGPGGGVTAIPPFIAFGLRRKKPYVGLYEQCCSAHLYAMCSFVDHVMAENDLSATIGSLGIVLSMKDDREALKLLGITIHEIYPDESKDKNQAVHLALQGNYDMIKTEMLSPLAIKFQNAVKAARPKLIEAPGVLTGKTFFTDQAIEYGLTDSLGNMGKAMDMVNMLSETRAL